MPDSKSDPISSARAHGVLAVLFLTVAGLLGYAVHQHYQVKHLSAENDLVLSTLKDTRAQMIALNAKLDSVAAQPAGQPGPVKVLAPRRPPSSLVRHSANDPRFKRLQTQLDAQGRAIASARQEFSAARTELQGGIARTHEELVTLQKKGERNYFEFDLDKSKQFQRTGPVAISLRKANTKHLYADLELRVEDAQVSQKHVNLFQPVVFYTSQEGRPVELVINSIRKNHIHGYISAPRYSAAELASDSSNGGNRRKLEGPR
ncbi:MAG TPA: hypothetical protein VLT16_09980 [Candidatus Limnocylindrales bacterium]|nr:hypothetical protein [Candidatus Limnocylindrales bacterium]